MNGDVLTTLDYSAMYQQHVKAGALATVGVYKRTVQVTLGTIIADEHDRVVDYVEKPSYEYLASIGIYIFSPAAIDYIPRGQSFDLPDLIKLLIQDGRDVQCYNHVDYWLDIGRPDDYETAQADFERMRSSLLPNDPA